MTKHGRIISEKQTTDPDLKNLKTKNFRGTGGVFHGKGLTILCRILFSS